MAFSAQTATDLNDILAKANTFFGGQGWTVNSFIDDASKYGGDVFTGKRLHLQKTMATEAGNVTVYANLRSANNQTVYEFGGTQASYKLTGIACNCSRGYDAGESWDYQPDSTNEYSASSVAGGANIRKTSAITCHFYSGTHSGAIIMTGTDQWYAVSFGVTNLGVPFYACSGGHQPNYSGDNYGWAKGMLTITGTSNNAQLYGSALWKEENSKWTHVATYSGITYLRSNSHAPPYPDTPSRYLIEATPDQYTGNPLLAPSAFVSTDQPSTYLPIVLMGNCPDITMVSMTNLDEAEVLTISSDEWVCYSVNNDPTYGNIQWGYAIKK